METKIIHLDENDKVTDLEHSNRTFITEYDEDGNVINEIIEDNTDAPSIVGKVLEVSEEEYNKLVDMAQRMGIPFDEDKVKIVR